MRLSQAQCDELESLIDNSSLSEVVNELTRICYAKAFHLLANWQDKGQAKEWTTAARKLESTCARISV